LLNGCYRSVVPLLTALSDKAGLFELHYAQAPGEHEHALGIRRWRSIQDRIEPKYAQPSARRGSMMSCRGSGCRLRTSFGSLFGTAPIGFCATPHKCFDRCRFDRYWYRCVS